MGLGSFKNLVGCKGASLKASSRHGNQAAPETGPSTWRCGMQRGRTGVFCIVGVRRNVRQRACCWTSTEAAWNPGCPIDLGIHKTPTLTGRICGSGLGCSVYIFKHPVLCNLCTCQQKIWWLVCHEPRQPFQRICGILLRLQCLPLQGAQVL